MRSDEGSDWRYGYVRHFLKHVESSLKTPQNALKEAEGGLEWMHNNFEFIRDGKTMKFSEALKTFTGSFETGFVKGEIIDPDPHIAPSSKILDRSSSILIDPSFVAIIFDIVIG